MPTNNNMSAQQTISPPQKRWRAYYELCKPRVVMLMLITAIVGMCLATPGKIPLQLLFFATLGIALAAASAAVINHLIDRKIDAIMFRTENRPIPRGDITTTQALYFALILGIIGLTILISFVNTLTTILTFVTLIGYAVIYTLFLKHATPQNIVIGGLAGAMPPLLGWTAITNQVDANGLLLVLIIFVWTPPHFWALAIHRYDEYAKAKIPMMPVTHGIAYTKLQIMLYTILLLIVSLFPYFTGMSGLTYACSAILLGLGFCRYSWRLFKEKNDKKIAFRTFAYSIYYLLGLFIALMIDHYIQ